MKVVRELGLERKHIKHLWERIFPMLEDQKSTIMTEHRCTVFSLVGAQRSFAGTGTTSSWLNRGFATVLAAVRVEPAAAR